MLQIKNLNLTHKKDLRVILSEFNLVLNKGDKAVIIGEEGNGKSTLMKWIYNPLLIDNYIEAEGERLVGKEILGYLPQEISEEDKEKTIYEFFSAEEMFWNRTPKELSEITGKFGMTSEFFYSDQKMGSLSGGEKVKAHLMRLIIQDVTVLLLDEPSNDIDINTLEILEKIINDWEHIVLFISHDETLIENTANTLAKLTTKDEERVLAEDINLKIRGSEKICIIGANGVGKTTLLRKIAEELSQRDDIKAEYMPQNYEEILDLDMTPVDFLDKSGDKEERTRIRTYLGSLKYTADEMEHPIRELSGGQKAKVLLLSMSLSGANVLILDEPTRNFSPLSGPVIRKMLREFPGAIISISHDRKYIDEVCDKIYELDYSGLRNL